MRTLIVLGYLALAASAAWGQCDACEGDLDGDDRVTINELVRAVNNALTDCQDHVACTGDGDCDADETCVDGRCVGESVPCDSDDDCDSDEHCIDGNCE